MVLNILEGPTSSEPRHLIKRTKENNPSALKCQYSLLNTTGKRGSTRTKQTHENLKEDLLVKCDISFNQQVKLLQRSATVFLFSELVQSNS